MICIPSVIAICVGVGYVLNEGIPARRYRGAGLQGNPKSVLSLRIYLEKVLSSFHLIRLVRDTLREVT